MLPLGLVKSVCDIKQPMKTDLFADGFVFDEFLLELVGSVKRAFPMFFHVVHLLLDRSHRVESRQMRHPACDTHTDVRKTSDKLKKTFRNMIKTSITYE